MLGSLWLLILYEVVVEVTVPFISTRLWEESWRGNRRRPGVWLLQILCRCTTPLLLEGCVCTAIITTENTTESAKDINSDNGAPSLLWWLLRPSLPFTRRRRRIRRRLPTHYMRVPQECYVKTHPSNRNPHHN